MSGDEELERAKIKFEEKMKQRLAKRIIRISEEDLFPPRLKTCIMVLKIVCALATFTCAPIVGWLYTEFNREAISLNMFIIFLFPMFFLGTITAITFAMKAPSE